MAPTDTLKSGKAGQEPPDPHAELRERIRALIYPSAPLTEEVLEELLTAALESGDPDLCVELIMTVHGRGALRDAREMADRAAARFPGNDRLAKVLRLMAPARVVPSPPVERIDRRPDYEWLSKHVHEYQGEWLVLGKGRLWGHAPNLADALRQASEAGLDQRPYVVRSGD